LGHQKNSPLKPDGFEPDHLLAQDVGDAGQRRALADIQQPLLEGIRLDHRSAPQCATDTWVLPDGPFYIFMTDNSDRAVGQCPDGIFPRRQQITVEATEITRILERKNLAATAFDHSVSAPQPFQKH